MSDTKNKRGNKSAILHQKINDLLKKRSTKKDTQKPDPEAIQLIRELETHLQELEMQNDRLVKDMVERKQIGKKVHLDDTHIQRYLNSDIIGVFIAIPEGKIIEANDYYLDIIGYTRAEFLTQKVDWRSFTPPEWLPADENALRELSETGTCKPYEKEYIKRDGNRVSVLLNDVMLPGPEEHIVGFAIDITRRKQTEKALQESNERYRNLIELAVDGVLLGTNEGFIIDANSCICKMLGKNRKELIGKHISDSIFASESLKKTPLDFEQLRKGETVVNERFIRHKDGSEITVEMRTKMMPDGTYQSIYRDITKRKHQEEELKQLNEALEERVRQRTAELIKSNETITQISQNYETFFNTIDDFLFVLDEQGKIIHTNTTVNNRLGYSSEELSGNSVLMVHPFDRQDEVNKIVGEMLKGEIDYCPIPLITKSGVQIPVETRVSYGFWNDKPVIFGVSKDISKLQLSEEKFKKVFYLNPSACSLTDLITKEYIEINEAFNNLLGFNKNEVIGKTSRELGILSPKKIKEIKSTEDKNGSVKNIETELITKNGDIRHVLMSCENIYLQDRKYRFTVVHDTTERKRSEKELKESELRYRTLFKTSPIGIIVSDENGTILDANEEIEKTTKFSVDELIGSNVQKLSPPSDVDTAKNNIQRILAGEILEQEVVNVRKDGEHRIIQLRETAITLPSGKKGILSISKDITEHKNTEKMMMDIIEKNPMSIQILDTEGFTLMLNPAHTKLFGSVPPSTYSVFKDPLLIKQGLRSYLERVKKGEVVHLPDTFYNAHDLYPDYPDMVVWLKSIIFPLLNNEGKPERFVVMHEDITEQKITQDALKESEEKYRLLFDNASQCILVAQDDYFQIANPKASELLGFTNEELLSKPYLEFIYPDDRDMVSLNYRNRLKGNYVHQSYHFRVLRKDKTIRWVEISAVLFKWKEKNATLNFLSDITQRKHAQEALLESEMKYRTIFENVQDIFYKIDINGKVLEISPSIKNYSGFNDKNIIGTSVFDLYNNPKDRITFLSELKYVSVNARLVFDKNGKPTHIDGAIRDINERRLVEEALKESQAKYQFIVENSDDLLWTMNGDLTFDYVSPSVFKFLGYTQEEHRKQTVYDYLTPESAKMVIHEFTIGMMHQQRKEFDQIRNRADLDLEFIRKDKTRGYARTTMIMVRDENHQLVKIRGFTTDTTIQKKAETDLKNSLEQLHLLSEHVEKVREEERIAISRELHDELGQALTAIKIDLGLIKQKTSDKEVVDRLSKVSVMLSDTIKNVQKLTSQLRPLMITDLGLEATTEWYADEFERRNNIPVYLDLKINKSLPDDVSLSIFRIIQESLTNVSRHSNATQIGIQLKQNKEAISLKITDNGIGISEKALTSNKSFGIIGMKERANSMGGTLDVYCENKKGTVVKLVVPNRK